MYSGAATLFFFILGVAFGVLGHKFYQEMDDDGGPYA